MTRYRWVAARKAEGFPTALCCRAARVSRRAFYGWRCARAAGPTDREAAEAALVAEIGEIWAGSDGAYGSPRVTAELRSRGHRVNAKRVARLMKAHQIAGIRPRRPKRTTIPARSAAKLPDLLRREFSPGAPDRAWCRTSPISAPARAGCTWRSCSTSAAAGCSATPWQTASTRASPPTRSTWPPTPARAAPQASCSTPTTPARPDGKLRSTAAGWGLAQSVGRVGSSADNAVAEAFFSSLKRELVNRRRYPDRATARRSVFEWLARYNTIRRHTSLGCLTPDQYEHHYRHTAGTTPALST